MKTSVITIQDCINLLKKKLYTSYAETEIDSFIKIIFEHLFEYASIDLYMNMSKQVSLKEYQKIHNIATCLSEHQPIQYVLGCAWFYDLQFEVNPSVLIPRPETEELVRWIIEDSKYKEPSILDIGTGSGCIAISLAKFIQSSKVFATDISAGALDIARINSGKNKADVAFRKDDILNPKLIHALPQFDIIVSNPPYVRKNEKEMMQDNVLKYEPHLALFVPDNDALVFYKAIADFAEKKLKPGGWLYFEINQNLGESTLNLLKQKGFEKPELRKDLFGNYRMIKCQKPTI